MPFNGSGTFSPVYIFTQDAANGIKILAARQDTQWADLCTNGFGNTITRDGQGSASANQPMNGFVHTGVGDATSSNQYASENQVQNGSLTYAVAGGSANAITATFPIATPSLVAGIFHRVKIPLTNTSATVTYSPDGLAAKNITHTAGGLAIGDLIANSTLELTYNGTAWELMNRPALGSPGTSGATIPLLNGVNTWSGVQTFSAGISLGSPLVVSSGGIGAATLTNHGILLGAGTSAINPTAVMTNGQLLVGQSAADPLPKTISGDATMAASGALTLATSGVTANTYNSATVTVDAKGRITSATSNLVVTTSVSTDQPITAGSTFTFSHGLGIEPQSVKFELICQTAEFGWLVGQVIEVSAGATAGTAGAFNVSFSARYSSGSVVVRFSNSSPVFGYINATTGATVNLTDGNWKMRITATAFQ